MSSQPKVLVLRAPGTNCDVESVYAFEQAGATAEALHVNALIEAPEKLDEFQILCLPGGFSYGDDIGAGQVLATQLMNRLGDAMRSFVESDKLILGICNGFQILMRSGLLVPRDDQGPQATLTWNDSGKFIDRWVHLAGTGSKCVFLKDVDQIYLPIAHAEGKFVTRTPGILEQLHAADQVALRYCKPGGLNGEVPFPYNPNGSQLDIAGLCDATGRVFGLMPHPERHIAPTHHPQWTRREGELPNEGEGMVVFRNAVEYFA